ncbi:MAG TPA: cysteine hydrolase family protein [Armatimonadota bacterium]|jgi:nicotinamidase-related amidase
MSRALLVIDVQNDYFSGRHTITHPVESFANIQRAMDVAHAAGMPIVLVQHTTPEASAMREFRLDTAGWEIADAIRTRPHDLVVEKGLPGSFTGTPLEAWLRARGVDTVVISGYMTQMCCDTTARQALHLGFSVEFLADATGTHDVSNTAGSVSAEELHRAILVTQAMRFSTVLSVAAWEELLNAQG